MTRPSAGWKLTGILLPLPLRFALEGLAARQKTTLSATVRHILADAIVKELGSVR